MSVFRLTLGMGVTLMNVYPMEPEELTALTEQLWEDAPERTREYAKRIANETGVFPRDYGRTPSVLSSGAPMKRSFENDRGRTYLCLHHEVDGLVYKERYPLRGTRLSDAECEAITTILAGQYVGVVIRVDPLRTDGADVRWRDLSRTLRYEGHVEVTETDDGNASSLSLHDAPFDHRTVGRGSALGVVVDDGTDLGGILKETLGYGTSPESVFGMRARVEIELLGMEETR